ncbi:MAG: hypothetical protein EKK48_11960 [Candidatus Melainabacteria bacterium]|nr:MAG: hypothetical protein EKK48_11960 [Candidatus Melainabacteria bacterium]
MIFSRNVTKLLFVGLISLSSLPALAIVRLSDLGPLEVRFFSHQYERETPGERLDRLERLVFGNVQSGSIEERVARISKTVDSATPGKPDTSIATQAKADQSASQTSKPGGSDLSNSEYPRVTELERSLLGRTYAGEPVRQRLSRLESKAYGAPSRIDDLATRVDNLSSYAGVYGMQPGDLMNNIPAPLRGATGITGTTQDGSLGMLEKVSAMEVKLFGHANSNHSLVQRIKDLESKVLGSAARSPVDDMTTRVSTLWARTQMGLPQSPQAPSQAATAQSLQSAPFSSSQYNRNWNSSNSYVAGASNPFGSGPTSPSSGTSNNGYSAQGPDPYAGLSGAGAGYNSMQNSGSYNSSPFMAGSSNPQFANNSKHKSKGKHSSLLGKIGKVVAIAGSAAVGAGGLAVGAMSSMNMGYYGMGMGSGFGSPYSYSSFAPAYSAYSSYPGYGSVSTIGTLGSMGSSFGSPFGSSYAGSFFSP